MSRQKFSRKKPASYSENIDGGCDLLNIKDVKQIIRLGLLSSVPSLFNKVPGKEVTWMIQDI